MKSVVEEIAHQNEKIDNTRNVFGVLKTEVDNVTSSIEGLAGKVEDLNGLKNSVTESVESLAAIAQENAAGTQETSASMVELSQIVNDCNQDTSKLVELAKELQNYVKQSTAPYKYPRIVEFVDELPKTISGKIRRVEIRENDSKKNS